MNFKYVFIPYICMYIVYIRDDFRSFVMPTIIFRERKKTKTPSQSQSKEKQKGNYRHKRKIFVKYYFFLRLNKQMFFARQTYLRKLFACLPFCPLD